MPEPIKIRYRGVWPLDRAYPIVHATADCILRLLCSNAFAGFQKGQVAYDIERKIKAQQAKHDKQWEVVTKAETELREQYPFVGSSEPVPIEFAIAFKEDNEKHRKLMEANLEGALFDLSPHEVKLLRAAIEVCHEPSAFIDPTKVMNQELLRWYTPILRVISGANTETEDAKISKTDSLPK